MTTAVAPRPFAYAALEAAGQTAVGHLDRSCPAIAGERLTLPLAAPDAWPCGRCVPLDVVVDWNRQAVQPRAAGRMRSAGEADAWLTVPSPCRCHADQALYGTLLVCPWCGHRSWDRWCASCERRRCPGPPEEFQKVFPQELKEPGLAAENLGVSNRTAPEDTTMQALKPNAPTAEDLAELKNAFAHAIAAGVEGVQEIRLGMLESYRRGTLLQATVLGLIPALHEAASERNVALDQTPAPPAPPASPAQLEAGQIVTNGRGQIVKVCQSKSTGKLYGKVREGRSWVYAGGALKGARPLTAEEAAAWGHEHHACVFCQTALDDPRSTTVGYGPICAGKYGLPWGVK